MTIVSQALELVLEPVRDNSHRDCADETDRHGFFFTTENTEGLGVGEFLVLGGGVWSGIWRFRVLSF